MACPSQGRILREGAGLACLGLQKNIGGQLWGPASLGGSNFRGGSTALGDLQWTEWHVKRFRDHGFAHLHFTGGVGGE